MIIRLGLVVLTATLTIAPALWSSFGSTFRGEPISSVTGAASR